jgi:POT family proton-dependent oligopeptide transporter
MGFSIFYVGINLGSLIGGMLAGYLSMYFGWSVPFYTAALGAVIGLIIIFQGVRMYNIDFEKNDSQISITSITSAVVISLITVDFCIYVLLSPKISNIVFIVISILCVLLLIYTAKQHRAYIKNCIAYLVLIIIAIVFWAIFFQMFSSLVILIEKLVNHNIFGVNLPTASFFTIESIGVVVLGGVIGKFWLVMANKGKPVHDSTKFAIGMFIITFAFASFALLISWHNPMILISGYVIVFIYFIIAIAELSLSPIGLSVSNKLAPPKSRGLFMGIWMISLGIGGKLSGVLAGITAIPEGNVSNVDLFHIYSHALWVFAGISCSALILSLIAIPFLKKLFR